MSVPRALLTWTMAAAASSPATAHHSYAMFDQTQQLSVSGTVATLEWRNPHVYIWLYVPSPATEGSYELYGFENASPNVLSRAGWSTSTLERGETLTVTYFPLKDGRRGGHFIRGTRPNGSSVAGLGGPGVHERLP
jgi:hypothetical protein